MTSKLKILFLTIPLFYSIISCKKEDKLFEKIESKHSKIKFSNNLKPTEALNAFTFTNFYNGGGVGVGDFNNDSLPDLFFTGNQVSSELYLNKGNLQFKNITQSAGLTTNQWCTGVSVIDINQDGWDDIYVSVAKHTSFKNSKNLLFINQKTKEPTFKEEAQRYGLDYEGFTSQTAFFDYDLDGDLDAFLLNSAPDIQNPNYLRPSINDGSYPSTDKLFRNDLVNGQVRFIDVSKEAGINYEGLGLGVVVSDFNEDGYPDIYCSNDFMSSDILYLNNQNGTFTNTIKNSTAHTSMFGMGVDAADLNNDLKIDLMQLDMLPEDNKRQKEMLGSQDFDKKQMSISSKFDYQLQYMRNSLQINQGNQANQPIFSEIGLLAGVAKTDWSWATLLSDLDNDGRKDIFITNGYRKNVTDKDFIQFNESENMFGTDQAKAVNREQLLTKVPEIKLRNYAYQNDAELGFKDVSESWGLDELSFANGAIYADLDLDGDLDLVVNNIDQEASIFKNKSNEKPNQNYLKIKFKGTENNKKGIGTKVFVYANGTQQVAENYPIRGFQSSVEQGIMFGLGKNQQADSIKVLWKNGLIETKYQVKSNQNLVFNIISAKKGILNKIENDPLFEDISESLQFNSIESDYVDFKQTPALHKMLSRHSNAIGIGDLNGDNLEDIVIGGTYLGNQTTIFIQQKDGKYLPKPLFQNQSNNNLNGQEIGDILIFDANGDNKNDILLVGGSNERPLTVKEAYQPILMLNESKGSFNPTNDFPNIQLSSQVIRAFDFDNDLDLDIFIGGRQIPNQYPYSPKSYFLMNEKGKFIDKTNEIASNISNLGMICDAQSIDFDNDNDQDLIVVGEWMPITLIENKNKKFEIKQQLKNSEGWWNCIKLADFDNDGDDDVLLGNEGLNSFYQANENEPVQVFAKDFNEDGQIDPIMGHYVKNQNVPVLPRETLIQQVIQFKKKYPFFAEYAKADFDDLFSDLNLDNCLKLKATELKSCYLENKGKGNFEMKPLPKLAQSSPIFSFIVDDFDGDKHLDALAIGNFYANEANMGRQDASSGIILKGDGKGNFKAENSISKGIDLRGDLRRSVFDKKSKKGFIVNCGGELKVFGVKKST